MKRIIYVICAILVLVSAFTACSRSGAPTTDILDVEDPGNSRSAIYSSVRVTTTGTGQQTTVTEAAIATMTTTRGPIEVITNYTMPTTEPVTVTTTAAPTTVPTTVPVTVAPTAAPTTAPTTVPTTAPTTAEEKHTVTFSIKCQTILEHMDDLREGKAPFVPADGVILGETTAEIRDGDSALDVLKAECAANEIQLEYTARNSLNTAYVEGINQLYEKDCGSLSGWIYKVNGEQPQKGADVYKLQPGDVVEWVYTCDLGYDV